MSNASHVRAMGWAVGTILDGSPVIRDGKEVERAKQRVITAIGQTVVVVRDRYLIPGTDEWGVWGSERFGTFDARTWTPVAGCDSCAQCIEVIMSTKPWPESMMWPFIVCATCGNKRCPHAESHALDCTGSNEPGQPGAVRYPARTASGENGA